MTRPAFLTGSPTASLPDHAMGETAQAAFYAMPISAFVLNERGRLVMYTRRAARLFSGTLAARATPEHPFQFADLTHLDEQALLRTLRDALSMGNVTLPLIGLHASAPSKPMSFHLSLMRIEGSSSPVYMLAQDHLKASAEALTNAIDQRERETDKANALQEQVTQLQRAVLSMESFARAASHDLRTPINAISGLLDLFARKFGAGLPDAAQTYITHMQRASRQMEDLTGTLLTHAQSAAAPLQAQKVSLADTVADSLGAVDPTLRLNASTIHTQGPDVALMAEPTMLRILLSNLFSNALKYAAEDRVLQIVITTTRTEFGATLDISDTGCGFAPEQANAIFAPFRRLDTARDGSGIGLATCAEICRRHGWEISASSDGTSGAHFTVTFPTALAV